MEENTAFDGARCPAIILKNLGGHHTDYLLGILNSSLATYYLRIVCPRKLSGYIEFSATALSQTPIRTINFADPADTARHDKMVALVERMLALHQKLAAAAISADRDLYQRQTWRELAERSRPPTGRLTGWCLLNSEQVRVVWVDGGGNRDH